MQPETFVAVLTVAIACIPLVASLWKIFNLLANLRRDLERQIDLTDDRVSALEHKLELKAQQVEHLKDHLELALNNLREVADHIRSRTKTETDRVVGRLDQIEAFLAKTTEYQPRTRQ